MVQEEPGGVMALSQGVGPAVSSDRSLPPHGPLSETPFLRSHSQTRLQRGYRPESPSPGLYNQDTVSS